MRDNESENRSLSYAREIETAAPSSECTPKLALETATTQTTPGGSPFNRVPQQARLALVAIPS